MDDLNQTGIYKRKRDFEIGGVGFCATTRTGFVNELMTVPTSPVSATVALIGVPGINSAKANQRVADVYNNVSFAAIDGMPIVRIARKKGFNAERCAAPDIMKPIIRESISQNKTHYFYGGKSDIVLERLKKNLESEFPEIRIVGAYSPPFRPLTEEEDRKVCADINEKKPDFLWIGIGAPKQELWMFDHRDKILNTRMIGVGAGFDFLAGTLDKAPKWMEDASVEWLYRLYKEPRRLWRRYIVGGVKWLFILFEERFKNSRKHND